MIKKITFLLLFFSVTTNFAQNMKALKASAIRDAKAACEATIKYDFKTLLTYTHPNIVEASGGAEVMEGFLKTTFDKMKADGFEYEKIVSKSVSDIVKEQGEYRCYVENYYVMKINKKRIISTSYMLGFYNEKARKWTFIEAKEIKSNGIIRSFFPDFKTSMKIPENSMTMEDIKQ